MTDKEFLYEIARYLEHKTKTEQMVRTAIRLRRIARSLSLTRTTLTEEDVVMNKEKE